MTAQSWTIIDSSTSAVVYASFLTEGEHPLAAGAPYSLDSHEFIPNDAEPRIGLDTWDGASWVPDLAVAKQLKWDVVKAQRDAREFSETVPTSWGLVQGNKESKQRIAGAVQGAMIFKMLGQPRTFTWTMADNSEPVLSVDEMIEFGMQVLGYVDACFAHARQLRKAIETAATFAELEAIDLEMGWPGSTS